MILHQTFDTWKLVKSLSEETDIISVGSETCAFDSFLDDFWDILNMFWKLWLC